MSRKIAMKTIPFKHLENITVTFFPPFYITVKQFVPFKRTHSICLVHLFIAVHILNLSETGN